MADLVAETSDRVLAFLGGHPFVVPVALVLCVLAVLLSRAVGRRLGCGRAAAALLLVACALPVAMTLTPQTAADLGTGVTCVTAVRPPSEWGRGGEELANVALLAPAGLLLALLVPRGYALVALLLAALFPVLVETVQMLAPGLGRLCETTDAVLNLLGLAAGAALGTLLRLLVRRRST